MKIETKYDIGQEVFIIYEDKMYKTKVSDVSILYRKDSSIQIDYHIDYPYIVRSEEEVFLTKDNLFQYLRNNIK